MTSNTYDPSRIEPKWQKFWSDIQLFKMAPDAPGEKCYVLMMFPYPSAALHVGHVRNYAIGDALVRYKIMRGFNVLSPMGWDAFGLPAENAAIKSGIPPAATVAANVDNMKRQLAQWGAGYDWDREINTSEPEYYRWTQWVFLKLYERGLAYKKLSPVNWCPSCKTTLANEEVVDGACERCRTPVEPKDQEQWFFKITEYAQKLLDDLELLGEWPEKVRTMQANWIGRSEGARIDFELEETGEKLPCFTTRPDTLWGVTFMSLAPEHPIIHRLVAGTDREEEVMAFVAKARAINSIERSAETFEKEGVFTGKYIINPVNGERVELWVANYALMDYGTGAVMAVPAHDQRDFEFAKKYDLPIRVVIQPENRTLDPETMTEAYIDDGVQVNSGQFDGKPNREALPQIIDYLDKQGKGARDINYRIRDWLISRQRYWGAPIPVVYCSNCGTAPVPESDLPVELPELDDFVPKGKSPLATATEWLKTTCPACGGPATRETDTIAQWLCSCWYFLRFLSPHDADRPFDRELVDKWLPVDHYIGGVEHAVLHLLYSRFIVKVLHDAGEIGFPEPFQRLFTQGMICREGLVCPECGWIPPEQVSDGVHTNCGSKVARQMAKMSKSKFNVVSPDELVEKFGADTVRLYDLFIGPPERDAEWSDQGVPGAYRFLLRTFDLVSSHADYLRDVEAYSGDGSGLSPKAKTLRRRTHLSIRKVTADMEGEFHFNTAISSIMELVNATRDVAADETVPPAVLKEAMETTVLLLAPFAPHISEELWEMLGHEPSIFRHSWPECDEHATRAEEVEIVVQINGKVRSKMTIEADLDSERMEEVALADPRIAALTEDKTIRKVVCVPNRLVNIVAR